LGGKKRKLARGGRRREREREREKEIKKEKDEDSQEGGRYGSGMGGLVKMSSHY
jgi:hypothetical protein